jgi:hypothetical protein
MKAFLVIVAVELFYSASGEKTLAGIRPHVPENVDGAIKETTVAPAAASAKSAVDDDDEPVKATPVVSSSEAPSTPAVTAKSAEYDDDDEAPASLSKAASHQQEPAETTDAKKDSIPIAAEPQPKTTNQAEKEMSSLLSLATHQLELLALVDSFLENNKFHLTAVNMLR